MTTTSKEVITKKAAPMAAYQANTDLLNMAPKADIKDIKFTKIKIHQGTTQGRKGMVGEIYEATAQTKLAGPEEKLNFIPITYYKRWFHNEKKPNESQPTPKGQSDFKSDAEYQWKEILPDGTERRNIRAVCFFGFLEKDLDDPAAMPTLTMFYSTNFTGAGRDLVTRYETLRNAGVEPWLNLFSLWTEQAKGKPHQVFKVAPVADKNGQKMVDEKYWANLRKWASTILTMQQQNALDLKDAEEVIDTAEVDASAPRGSQPLNEAQLQY